MSRTPVLIAVLLLRHVEEQGMGIILMRPLTSGVFQRWMASAFPQLDTLDVGRLLLNYVLSDPHVDVALVGMREPRFVDLSNKVSDDVASRIDGCEAHLGGAAEAETTEMARISLRRAGRAA